MKREISNNLPPFSQALHNKFGFVSGVYVSNTHSTTIRMFMLRTEEYYDYIRQVRVASAGSTRSELVDCIGPAFGETFERYSLSVEPPASKTIEKSVEEMSSQGNALSLQDLRKIQGLHPLQFSIQNNSLERIENSTRLNWFKAHRLLDDSEVWVPTVATVLKINKFYQVTTNGCAIQKNKKASILKASYELMERDSFLKMWWRQERPVFLNYKSILKKIDPKLYHSFGPWIDLVHVAYIPNEFKIPVLFGVFRSSNKEGHPALMISGGAHLNPEKALVSVMNEMAASINHKMAIYHEKDVKKYKDLFNYDRSIHDFHEHTYYYMFDEFAEKAHFVSQIDNKETLSNISDLMNTETDTEDGDLKLVKEAFKAAAFNPVVVDFTSDDVQNLGFSVVRMLDPKTIDLNANHAFRPWGKERLFCDKIRTIADLNQLPHPFP